jgi:hypothetical protein
MTAQADSINTTSRRRFLAIAGGAAVVPQAAFAAAVSTPRGNAPAEAVDASKASPALRALRCVKPMTLWRGPRPASLPPMPRWRNGRKTIRSRKGAEPISAGYGSGANIARPSSYTRLGEPKSTLRISFVMPRWLLQG